MKAKVFTLSLFTFILTLIASTSYAQQGGAKNLGVHDPNKSVAQHYEGGLTKLNADIKAAIVYPMMAKRMRKQGQCVIKIKLHADGTVSGYEIVKNIGATCGEEALRVVKTLKFNAPGYDQDYKIAVNFSLR